MPTPATPAEPAPPRNWGGSRPGAGRKPGGSPAIPAGDLAYAKDLVVATMRNEKLGTDLRVRCALAVLRGGPARCRRKPAPEPARGA